MKELQCRGWISRNKLDLSRIVWAAFIMLGAARSMVAQADPVGGDAQPLAFRHEEPASATQALLGLGFVAVLAAVGFGLKRHFQIIAPSRAALNGQGLRIVQFRRVGPRLSVVRVEIDGRRTVVFADNGNALLTLADWTEPSKPPAGQAMPESTT